MQMSNNINVELGDDDIAEAAIDGLCAELADEAIELTQQLRRRDLNQEEVLAIVAKLRNIARRWPEL